MMFRSLERLFPCSVINTTTKYRHDRILTRQRIVCLWTLADALSPCPDPAEFQRLPEKPNRGRRWQTASESNTGYFEIWRSQDPLSFAALGRVDAAGNSSRLLNYSFTDDHPLAGDSYYA